MSVIVARYTLDVNRDFMNFFNIAQLIYAECDKRRAAKVENNLKFLRLVSGRANTMSALRVTKEVVFL